MRILLLHPPLWTMKSPPLNVTYLAAFCKRLGHEVLTIDANAEWFRAVDEPLRRHWDRADQFRWEDEAAFAEAVRPEVVDPLLPDLVARAEAFGPDLVGVTTNSKQLAAVLADTFGEALPGVPLVLGGQTCFPGFHGRQQARSGRYAAVVYGEGEETFAEIAQRLAEGRGLAGIPGTLVLAGGDVVDGGPREPIEDVDSLPYPDFDDLDLAHYTEQLQPPHDPSVWLTGLMTRGCVNRCDFCLQRVIWSCRFRARSAASVVAELDHQSARYHRTAFHFNDLAVNGHHRRLMELCDLLIERGAPYAWCGNANIDRRMDADYVRKLRDSGCQYVTIGIEAASDPVLEAMGKPYTAEQLRVALSHLRDAGIRYFTNLVVGHPAEGPAEFDETIAFIRRNRDLFEEPPSSSLCLIQRGTPLHTACEEYGIHVNGGDSAGWYALDGRNDLDERRRRAAVLDLLYQELYGHGICMTDKNDPRLAPADDSGDDAGVARRERPAGRRARRTRGRTRRARSRTSRR